MKSFGKGFLQFVDSSPTPFHVCDNVSKSLECAGFLKLTESTPWVDQLRAGGKYYFTRNGSSLVAFTVGGKYKSGNGFKVIGAHTDSPVLKVKPVSKQSNNSGCEQVGVECYGGGLWHTWFDRDLGIAGRVVVYAGKQQYEQKLVHISDPILRVPTLCIHLQTTEERDAFRVNKEDHLKPILAVAESELNSTSMFAGENQDDFDVDKRHSSRLMNLLAQKIGCQPADIVDFELSLCDSQKSTFGGLEKEFVFAPRCDNQIHCYTGSNAMVAFANTEGAVENDDGVCMVSLFDHEEVGSDSNEGAGSPLLRDTIHRITACFSQLENQTSDQALLDEKIRIGLSKSILLSSDCAHAIHPNYASKHERNHQPKMGGGTVIKTNQSQRYATNAVTGFFVRELARRNTVDYDDGNKIQIPVQEFVVRNDISSGSTIGPILAHGAGIRTVDIGVPQLSMHSIREQCAVKDLWSNFHLMTAFYKEASEIDKHFKY